MHVHARPPDNKTVRLHVTIAALQAKWGADAIHLFRDEVEAWPGISTGYPALDAALAPVCVSRGHLTELLGKPTSGMTTLAHHIVACAQTDGQYALYIDLEGTFDPDYAAHCGVALDRFFLACPDTEARALDIARDLIGAGQVGIIVLDLGQLQPGHDRLYRLTTALLHSRSVLLRLELLPRGADMRQYVTSSPAALRLGVERLAWHEQSGAIAGYRSCIHILKARHGMSSRVEMDVWIDKFEPGSVS